MNCPICKKGFADKETLLSHLITEHWEFCEELHGLFGGVYNLYNFKVGDLSTILLRIDEKKTERWYNS